MVPSETFESTVMPQMVIRLATSMKEAFHAKSGEGQVRGGGYPPRRRR
jgi:hypothetical protein